ncbi:cytochrome c biogenesis protein CcsA [Sphingobacterium sp. E70]|uniref:cytochrome c biogenesis protein CcsA n=1 Tax=Sphingobacterium sp. E70 TaxID=2853439 RepID=UPI002795E914|nr:cytochrome c biogenesis protein CcsA [Sphingobacterium sp. E70]
MARLNFRIENKLNSIYHEKKWWKILAVLIICAVIINGLLGPVPRLFILHESIRNVYFHVPMWSAMIVMYLISVIYSIKYLNTGKQEYDLMAIEAVNTGITFCFFGLATGMLWANITWGEPWPNDPKLNGSAIATLMYLAYLVLRNALEEEQKGRKYLPSTISLLFRSLLYYSIFCQK